MAQQTKKQKIKPSPVMVLIFGTVLAVAGIVIGIDVYTGGTPSWEETSGTAVLIILFIYYLVKFIFGKRIEFDFDGFIAKGKSYRFSEISEAEISHKRVLVPSKRLRLRTLMVVKVYIRGDCVLKFTEHDIGYEEFVALLKKHRVKFHIKNSLSSWRGEIE